MEIQFNEKNGKKTDSVKSLITSFLDIIALTGYPLNTFKSRALEQLSMSCLALGGVKDSIEDISSSKFITSKEIIKYWNKFFGDTMSAGSYDSIRDNCVKKLVDYGIAISQAKESSLTKNSSTAGYALSDAFVTLVKSYGTENQSEAIDKFRSYQLTIQVPLDKKRFEDMTPAERRELYRAYLSRPESTVSKSMSSYLSGVSNKNVNVFCKDMFDVDNAYELDDVEQIKALQKKVNENKDSYVGGKDNSSHLVKYIECVEAYLAGEGIDTLPNRPRQIITYGAPGTGKSFSTDFETAKYPSDCTIRTTFHPDSDYSTFVGAYKPIKTTEGKISYEFIPQAFMKAYIQAWKDQTKPVFLIIEEVNRGNCAQIFGDLFQLLDRNEDNMSAYDITPDQDIQTYISQQGLEIDQVFAANGKDEITDKIISGEVMALPANLYIWATMNTSDQSLFPIDSAFKRRWEWKYVKIAKGKDKETGEEYNWKLEANDRDWWDFIKQINRIIANMTSSADKQLGYFFCKPDNEETISYERFVNKVLFYLWNDVFKDYGFDDKDLFTFTDEDGHQQDLTFPDFFGETGDDIETARVDEFVQKVMSWEKKSND